MAEGLVLLDMDGTLVDGERQIGETMAAAFEAAGLPAPTRAEVARTIGLSVPEMVTLLAQGAERDVRDKILAGYRLRYADSLSRLEEPPIFEGAELAIRQLRQAGWTLGLATGKSRGGVDYVLDAMHWEGHFATVQCADDNRSKPHPEMILRAMAELNLSQGQTVMVGDTTYDMEMGRAAGVRTLGVGWGYHAAVELVPAGAEAVVSDFTALVDRIGVCVT